MINGIAIFAVGLVVGWNFLEQPQWVRASVVRAQLAIEMWRAG